jgi:hypothetical protein
MWSCLTARSSIGWEQLPARRAHRPATTRRVTRPGAYAGRPRSNAGGAPAGPHASLLGNRRLTRGADAAPERGQAVGAAADPVIRGRVGVLLLRGRWARYRAARTANAVVTLLSCTSRRAAARHQCRGRQTSSAVCGCDRRCAESHPTACEITHRPAVGRRHVTGTDGIDASGRRRRPWLVPCQSAVAGRKFGRAQGGCRMATDAESRRPDARSAGSGER